MPWIQDRLRSAATRSKETFASWPVIFQSIVTIFFLLPEILNTFIGLEGIMPILSEIPIRSRIDIILSFSIAIFASLQYKINKTLLIIEQNRERDREHDRQALAPRER